MDLEGGTPPGGARCLVVCAGTQIRVLSISDGRLSASSHDHGQVSSTIRANVATQVSETEVVVGSGVTRGKPPLVLRSLVSWDWTRFGGKDGEHSSDHAVSAISYVPRHRLLVSGSDDGSMLVWKREDAVVGPHEAPFAKKCQLEVNSRALAVDVRNDGSSILVSSHSREALCRVWDIGRERQVRTLDGRAFRLCHDAIHQIQFAAGSSTILGWDYRTRERVFEHPIYEHVTSFCCRQTKGCQLFVTCRQPSHLMVIDARMVRPRDSSSISTRTFVENTGHLRPVHSCLIDEEDRDFTVITCGYQDHHIKAWNEEGECLWDHDCGRALSPSDIFPFIQGDPADPRLFPPTPSEILEIQLEQLRRELRQEREARLEAEAQVRSAEESSLNFLKWETPHLSGPLELDNVLANALIIGASPCEGETAIRMRQGGTQCLVCDQKATVTCQRCKLARYCSGRHQFQDQARHRHDCVPYVDLSRPSVSRDVDNMLEFFKKMHIQAKFICRPSLSRGVVTLALKKFFSETDPHLCVLYYTGHGNGDREAASQGAWILQNPETGNQEYFSFADLQQLWIAHRGTQNPSRRLIVILEACHSGQWVDSLGYEGARNDGIFIQSSCSPTQNAHSAESDDIIEKVVMDEREEEGEEGGGKKSDVKRILLHSKGGTFTNWWMKKVSELHKQYLKAERDGMEKGTIRLNKPDPEENPEMQGRQRPMCSEARAFIFKGQAHGELSMLFTGGTKTTIKGRSGDATPDLALFDDPSMQMVVWE